MKQTILRECLRIAKIKNIQRNCTFRHFSFVIQNNKIIEWATNIPGSNSSVTCFRYPPSAGIHAEFFAYKKAKGILNHNNHFEIINIRLNKIGNLKMSKPCKCCTTFLIDSNCKTVWFSTDIGFARLSLNNK